VYVSGSPAMIRATVHRLAQDGLSAERVHFDQFVDRWSD
jgi:ferredoxin-NADP reductase